MAAPKGNKFALFNKGGSPRRYETPEDMEPIIEEYFESYNPENDLEPLGHKPTVNGLALYLGFYDRHSLYDYRDNHKEFAPLIKKALTLIEMNYENLLESKYATGAIFALKNMKWTDKQEIKQEVDAEITIKTERGIDQIKNM
ncbi:MAG: hypothetical protein HRU26_12210 [Psychroserpens sp.]|nr:hypothetical protein [Psychroserpens sp.]